jgi:chromosome segregation ATPase
MEQEKEMEMEKGDGSGAGPGYGDGQATSTATSSYQNQEREENVIKAGQDGVATPTKEENRERAELKINLENVDSPAQDVEQLMQMNRERKEELEGELQNYNGDDKVILQNQNKVREAVHTLLAAEDVLGAIGPQVSEIARNMNEGVQNVVDAENSINSRGFFSRFFFGGDDAAALELERERDRIQNQLVELNQVLAGCEDCPEGALNMIQEQIRAVEQEEKRIGDVVEGEKGKKGLFDYLFGWIS